MTVGINQKTAPIRFCFIIRANDNARFLRAIELACSLWGGIFSPILPFYIDLPDEYRCQHGITISTKEFYDNTINNYDPDIILVDEDIDKEAIKKFIGERQIEEISAYLDNLNSYGRHAVSIVDISEHFLREEFKFTRSDGARLSIPKVTEEANQLLMSVLIGLIPTSIRAAIKEMYTDIPAFEEPDLNWETIMAYRADSNADILTLNIFRLQSWTNTKYLRGAAIYFLRSDSLQDILNFWNLRAAGWQVIPIPIDIDDHAYFKVYLKRYIDWSIDQTHGSVRTLNYLLGQQVHPQNAHKLLHELLPDLAEYPKQILIGHQPWFPRFWSTDEILQADFVKSHTPYFDAFFAHYEAEEGRIHFKPRELGFKVNSDLMLDETYKVILSLSVRDDLSVYAEAITGITTNQLRQLIQTHDFRSWRLSSTGIHRFVDHSNDEISFEIPKALDFFESYFTNKRFKLSETVNSKLAKEVLKNLGGLFSVRYFLRPSYLKIIEQFGGGTEVTFSALLADIKRQLNTKKNPPAHYFIKRLLTYKVIEMGAVIQCKVCEQRSFFLPMQLLTTVTCPICRNDYQLPMDNPTEIVWSYRGIGPFSRNNKADGVWSVFATLRLFRDEFGEFPNKVSSLFGFELLKHGQSEIREVDLGLIIQDDSSGDNDLIFCECKTYKKFAVQDVERMKMLGDEFPGSILTFATLNTALTADEINIIASVVRHFQKGDLKRPQNPVLILTGNELLPTEFRGEFAAYEGELSRYHIHNDKLGALCELSVKKHLGIPNWLDIQEQRWNAEI